MSFTASANDPAIKAEGEAPYDPIKVTSRMPEGGDLKPIVHRLEDGTPFHLRSRVGPYFKVGDIVGVNFLGDPAGEERTMIVVGSYGPSVNLLRVFSPQEPSRGIMALGLELVIRLNGIRIFSFGELQVLTEKAQSA